MNTDTAKTIEEVTRLLRNIRKHVSEKDWKHSIRQIVIEALG